MANFTQKAIIHTFEEMLKEMPFDKIKVSEIVKRCEISSNTFYYHYHDIYDLLDKWLEMNLEKYEVTDYSDDAWKDTIREMLYDIRDNKEIVEHLFYSLSRDRIERYMFNTLEKDFYQAVKEKVGNKPVSEETQWLLACGILYTMSGFIIRYIWNGMREDVDDYFEPLSEMLDSCMASYIEKETQH